MPQHQTFWIETMSCEKAVKTFQSSTASLISHGRCTSPGQLNMCDQLSKRIAVENCFELLKSYLDSVQGAGSRSLTSRD